MFLPSMYYVIYAIWFPLISTFLVPNVTVGNSVSNSDIHSINTRHITGPNCVKINYISKGVCYFGIKVFNHLPPGLEILSNELKQFRLALKQFLHIKSYYSLDESFN